MRTFRCEEMTGDDLAVLGRVVEDGGVLVYPTETVYGIGCDPRNKEALEKVFSIKERPVSGDVSVAFASIEEAEKWIDIPQAARKLMETHTPGPLTVLVPRPAEMDTAIPSGPLFGIRIPSHPLLQKLLPLTGPLISTSANRHGAEPTPEEAKRLGGMCDALILCNEIEGKSSTVVAFPPGEEPRIIRQGALSIDF